LYQYAEKIITAIKAYIEDTISISEFKYFLNKKCSNGYTALHYAAFRGNIDIIKLIIENGGDYLEKNTRGLNLLHVAAQGDQPEILIYFKDKYKMDILERDFNGSTPLHWACFMSSDTCVDFILTWINREDVNIQEAMGYSPLHLAIFSGNFIN
jgi:ankyrin repeat protein